MINYIIVIISMVFVTNFVLARFLGLCPFIGVSKKTSNAVGMGLAVIFVMTLASAATYVVYTYVLSGGEKNIFGLSPANDLVPVLKVVSYILIIAALVQLVEIILKKTSPALYRALGIFLPLITTNCAVMGVALLNTTDASKMVRRMGFAGAIVQGFGAGVGFMLALILMSAIRERLEISNVPKPLRGIPIALITASLMALAFMGFQNLVKMD